MIVGIQIYFYFQSNLLSTVMDGSKDDIVKEDESDSLCKTIDCNTDNWLCYEKKASGSILPVFIVILIGLILQQYRQLTHR